MGGGEWGAQALTASPATLKGVAWECCPGKRLQQENLLASCVHCLKAESFPKTNAERPRGTADSPR